MTLVFSTRLVVEGEREGLAAAGNVNIYIVNGRCRSSGTYTMAIFEGWGTIDAFLKCKHIIAAEFASAGITS